jgi:hypothetical protein
MNANGNHALNIAANTGQMPLLTTMPRSSTQVN